MDIFSSVRDISQKTHNIDNISTHKINKNEEIQKPQNLNDKQEDILKNQDKNKLKKELQKLTMELNKALEPLRTSLKFHFNDKIDELTIKVVDTKSNKVIREYPSKEALELMEKMREVVGLLFDKKG